MAFLTRKQKTGFEGSGLVIFPEVADAMKAEKVLEEAGYQVKLVAPPPQLRKGCDLAVEINLAEQPGIQRVMDGKDVFYAEITPTKTGTAELLEIVQVTDFGKWVMVKAANMKLTYAKETGTIVNVSGGGCPDIPHLHARLIDRPLTDVPRPKDIGFTLCALMLDRALEEAQSLWQGGDGE